VRRRGGTEPGVRLGHGFSSNPRQLKKGTAMTGRETEPRQTPDQVQGEIDREQRRLAETLDKLSVAARPSNIARRQIDRARRNGSRLVDEARALVVGGGAVRVESRLVEAEECSIVRKGDYMVVSPYSILGELSPETIFLAVGVDAVVTVGVVAWVVRRNKN